MKRVLHQGKSKNIELEAERLLKIVVERIMVLMEIDKKDSR